MKRLPSLHRAAHRRAGLLLCALGLAGAACSQAASADPGLNATVFLQTRVPQVMTENAQTNAAPPAAPTVQPVATTAAPLPGVIPGSTYTPTPAQSGLSVATFTPLPLPTAGATITVEPAGATNTPGLPCPDQACASAAQHFWLERPISAGNANFPDRTYPYGSTLQNMREPHHGVEFVNPSGTPVLAAGPGTVVVAGNDWVTAYGPSLYFYGNLVVIELDQKYHGLPVYNLYAHLEAVTAQAGQHVAAGDQLGTVGYTGVAVGPHLHFEVRVGHNDYLATRNPELWLKPLVYNGKRWGVIAGRVQTADGRPVDGYTVVIRPVAVDYEDARVKYVTTYARETLNGDDTLQENFAINDLPLGTYTVAVNTSALYQQTVTVAAGQLTWVTFTVSPPAP
jgi:murein DD-endopeptidase MepM/ murein hydrolase activator NlpD